MTEEQLVELINRQVAISLLRLIVDYRKYQREKGIEPGFDDLSKMLEWAIFVRYDVSQEMFDKN